MLSRMANDYLKVEAWTKERSIVLGEYIKQTGATVRDTAKIYGISKSTVHKDVTERLYMVNESLYNEVQTVLRKNKAERHIRGGNATRNKYIDKKTKK